MGEICRLHTSWCGAFLHAPLPQISRATPSQRDANAPTQMKRFSDTTRGLPDRQANSARRRTAAQGRPRTPESKS